MKKIKRYYAISEELFDKSIINNKDIPYRECVFKVVTEGEYKELWCGLCPLPSLLQLVRVYFVNYISESIYCSIEITTQMKLNTY